VTETPKRTTVDALIKILKGENPGEREEAARKLGEMGAVASKAVPALIRALDDEDCWVPGTAAVALGQIGPPAKKAIPHLIAHLTNANARAQPRVVESLSKFGTTALPELKRAFEHDSVDQRIRVMQILGQMKRPAKRIVSLLHNAVKDDHSLVRLAAVEALAQCGKDAVEDLIVALEDEHSLVRTKSAEALGNLGSTARKAMGALKQMEGDRVKGAKQAALKAMQAIASS